MGDARKKVIVLLFATFLLPILAAIVLVPSEGLCGKKSFKIGVLANRGFDEAVRMWSPTAVYLNAAMPGYSFSIVPLDFHAFGPAVSREEVDFILTNTSHYVELEALYGVSRIATLRNRGKNGGWTLFGGVIFCRSDRSDIKELRDLAGKSFAAVDETSMGGWQVAWRELKDQEIDPYRDFSSLLFAGTHDSAVQAVRYGLADAGTARTDTLERMAEEGKIDLNAFRILHPQQRDHFPFALSTRLYPEWPFAKLKHTDDELAQKVAIVLLGMSPGSRAAKTAKIVGWTIPLDYQPVHEMMKELHLGPYKHFGKSTLISAAKQHWYWVVAGALAILFMAGAVLFMLKFNRRLTHSQQLLEKTNTLLDTLVQAIPDIVFFKDERDRYLVVNKAAEEFMGFRRDEIVGKTDAELLTPELFEYCKKSDDEVKKTRKALRFEEHYNLTKGEKGLLETIKSPIFDSSGRFAGLVGVSRDITDRKLAEEALLAEKQYSDTIIDSLPGIFYLVDIQGKILRWNNNLALITGYTAEEIARMHPLEFFKNEDRQIIAHTIREVFETGQAGEEAEITTKDGRKLPYFFTGKKWIAGKHSYIVGMGTDIAGLKRAEKEKRESEKLFRAMFNNSPLGLLLADTERRIIACNPALQRMTGYGFEDMRGLSLSEISHPDDDRVTSAYYREMMEGKRTNFRTEKRHLRKDGSILWTNLTGSMILDENNNPAYLFSMIEDISDRKKAEKATNELNSALVRQLRFTETLLRTVPLAVFYKDADGRYLGCNAEFTNIMGVTSEEITGKTVFDLWPGELSRTYHQRDVELLQKPAHQVYEFKVKNSKGELLNVVYSKDVFLDESGRVGGIIGTFLDITERKRAEEEILRAKEQWEKTFDAVPDLIALIDREHRIIRVNKAMANKLGVASDEAIGRLCYEQVHGKDAPPSFCPHSRLLADGKEHIEEIREDRLGGTFHVSVSPLHDDGGQVMGSVHIAHDITQLKRMESELEKLNATLELRVQQEIDLRFEKERMLVHQSRLAAMGEMIGAIAHQWRQPLNAVGVIVQDIRDAHAYRELDKAYLDRSVESAMEQIGFMSKTIDDFRNFFRPDKEKKKFEVKQTVANVLAMLTPQLASHGIAFRLICHVHNRTFEDLSTPIICCEEMELLGYENEMKQVFLNIINNAQYAIGERLRRGRMGPGERGAIVVDFERSGPSIVIRFTDNGGGIPAENLDRIFEPYFTTKGLVLGTGLGLYMSKMIVENSMGGSLSARNVANGAEFRIEVEHGKC